MIQWVDASYSPSKIVAMCEHQGRLFVATESGVFEKKEDGKLHQLMFVNPELGMLSNASSAE